MKKVHVCLLFFLTILPVAALFAQQQLTNGNMSDSAGWTVYHQGSAFPASYAFNYTAQTPAAGAGGCLRITSPNRTNILFWQKLSLQVGKSYVVNGAFKTGMAASFWCEIYLSTIAPNPNADYAPNNNGDVVRGFSTWAGCGPNTDGTFVMNGCSGKKVFKVPGTDTSAFVDVYFAIKTGSSATTLPAPLEVLIDELEVSLINDYSILSTTEGSIDTTNHTLINVTPGKTVTQLKGALQVAPTATVDIVSLVSGLPVAMQDTAKVSDTMAVLVKGLNGSGQYPITLRDVGEKNKITNVSVGLLNPLNASVWLPINCRVAQLRSAITVSPHATFTITDTGGVAAPVTAYITNQMKIVVTAENGASKTYSIKRVPLPMLPFIRNNYTDTVAAITNKILLLFGNAQVTITGDANPLKGSMLDLRSENVWLYFPNIKPSVLANTYLPQIMVDGKKAVIDSNIRVEQYLQGTMVISHPHDYKPLQVYDGLNRSGASQQLGMYTYNRAGELGGMHDAIKSFRLKKGYMATFAKDSMGTGYSRVYIADKQDLVIDSLPAGLYNDVSFVRVLPWRWVAKKGWTSGRDAAEALNASWQYDWDNVAVSGHNVEYIPMRHNRWWNAFSNINNKKKSTHALGFNEPERTDQANMSIDDALALWPELMRSGLRLGSPSPSDGGLEWLYSFIDRADALNYRVDFVAMHFYLGGQTPQQLYNRLKAIHDRTGRPLWITEWNNGANWTCCTPGYADQAETIAKFLNVLDTCSFVERYALYEWVGDTRRMFYKSPTVLTPAGMVYRDKKSPMAYNEAMAFNRPYIPPPQPPIEYAGVGVGFDYGKSLSADIDNDGDLDIIYSGVDPYVGGIMKNDGHGNFTSTGQSIPGIYTPGINAGDVDGDGDLDVIVAGWDRANAWAPYARLLRNDGTGFFTLETMPQVNAPVAGIADLDNNGYPDYFMIGNGNANKFYFQNSTGVQAPVNRVNNAMNIQDPDASWVDIDNDQDIDFCVQAWNRSASRRYTQVWKNNGDGTFAEQAVPFKQKHWGSSQFADVDADGDLDMLLNGDGDGYSDAGSHDIYRLYLNDGTGNYTEKATFQNYRQNCNGKGSAFVDWDNDGDYDILLTGRSSSEAREVTNIFLNDGTGVFTKSPESLNLPGINKGTIELGDFDHDGRTDVLLNGYSGAYTRNVAFLFKNVTMNTNNTPLAPSGLQAQVAGDSVQLNWTAGADAETPVKALSYNLYVKGANGHYYIFPNANISTGVRMTSSLGNAYQNLGWKLKGLPPGDYVWSVQTIDAAYAGSAFAPEGSFTIGATQLMTARQAAAPAAMSEMERGVVIYPNPVKDQLVVQYGAGAQIVVHDVMGRVVHVARMTGAVHRIDVSKYMQGTYFIQVKRGGEVVTRKIVKE
ncbi:glycosyl hydrolase [Niastella populi]|uniref:Fibronectin type-III domain-containing protein n=1 Tax=Niastella populi TaxID=550983 RepID=A0A1V9EZ12_9BACT|nr:glycosyl hydrolase [Niastella populi]OQP51184.1 hypothetical protein A4R26_29660 [Niastella populi]